MSGIELQAVTNGGDCWGRQPSTCNELLRLEWPDVDMHRREFTLQTTKNGKTRTVPMTPKVYRVFTELWQEQQLDTQPVFLYKEKP
jgi:integrase